MDLEFSKPVAVVGAGLMGHGIAQVFAKAGHHVFIYDVNLEVLKAVPDKIRKNLQVFKLLGLIDDEGIEACLSRVKPCDNLSQVVSGADLVIEAIYEDRELKRALFREIEPILNKKAIVCSNTSAISITELSEGLGYRERFVGTHFWNPPQIIPCVEVIMGKYTSKAAFESVYELLKAVDKEPVRVLKDVPGFLGNRLQHAMWREAISMVEKGVASPEEIDKVVKYGFGLRLPFLGPLETADLAGLDLTYEIHEYLFPYLDNSLTPSPELKSHVENRKLGVKTLQGFHSWSPEKIDKIVTQRDLLLLTIIKKIKTIREGKG